MGFKKVNWTNDDRAKRPDGRFSQPRMIVLEGLEAQGMEGATRDELVQLIGGDMNGDSPAMSIGRILHALLNEEHVVLQFGRWYLKECAPDALESRAKGSNSSAVSNGATNGHKVQIAPFFGKRTGKRVSLYTGHRVFDDVVAINLLIAGRWWPVMLADTMRIMVAFDRPDWSPDQVTYSDVEMIRFTYKAGTTYEERPAPKDLVTIAPGE